MSYICRIMKKLLVFLVACGVWAVTYGADRATVAAFTRAEDLIGEGELDDAARIIDSILRIPSFETDTMYGRVLVEKATMHYYGGDIPAMADASMKALGVVDPDGDQIVNTSLWNNLAVVYNRRERPDSALICYRRALEHAARANDPSWESALECNIGMLYYNRGKFELAYDFFGNAVMHAAECEDGYTELSSSQLAAMALLQPGRINEAGERIRHAWALAKESGDPALRLRCIPGLYGYFEASAQPDSADFYMELGRLLLPAVSAGGTLAGGYRSARVRWDIARGRYADALAGLDILRRMDFAPPGAETYRQIATCMAGLGRYREAYAYSDSAIMWTDTLAARNMTRALAEFDVQYGTMRRDLENGELRNRVLARERMMLALGLLLALAAIVVLVLVLRQRRLKAQMALERSEQYIRGMEEERRVFARELHDGVAADLLALRLNISNGHSDTASIASMAEQLRLTVRAISHRLMPPEFSGRTLGQIIGSYARSVSGEVSVLTVDFVEADVPADIPEPTAREIYRIFQEEMTNIIKYGKPTHVDISLMLENGNVLHLTIDHNGTPAPEGETGTGIGHRTIGERLRIIGATLTHMAGDSVSSTHITVPL